MSVTIKKIAEVSGVSRGTVDRVLNNRGKVNAITEKKVKDFAKQLGYKPNIAGKALAATKKGHIIAVIIPSRGNPFFDDVITGIKDAAKMYADYGIKLVLKEMKGYDADLQLKLIEEVESTASGIIIAPIDDIIIRNKINDLSIKNIGVVTLNIDIKDCEKISYVGTNYYDGGKIAAGILQLFTSDCSKIGIIHGSNKVYGHTQRVKGFKDNLPDSYEIVDIKEGDDDDITSYETTQSMLKKYQDINSIYIVAGGVYGVCRAVTSSGRDISVISFDDIPVTVEMLKAGIIKATISQQPKFQGKKSMQIMFDYLIKDEKPYYSEYIVENQIKIKENY